MNTLLDDILKFKDKMKTRQRYLENTAHMPRPNAEMEATPAETIAELCVELENLLAKYIVDNNLTLPTTQSLVRRELERRKTLYNWGMIV